MSTHIHTIQSPDNNMLLADKESEGLVEFFKVRNPTTDLSLNVNSLLTKPIVVSHLCSKPCLSYEWSCSLSENFKVPTVPEGHMAKESEEGDHLRGEMHMQAL